MADRCPSCGRELGEIVSTRYKGTITVLRYRPDPDDVDAELEEHLCGDNNLVT